MSQISDTEHQGTANREEMLSALFAHMVMQQSSIAMMMLGKTPHPETGKTIQDLDGARLFIDQLEMLEAKTKGNLSTEEAQLLKQSLMNLRMVFVEVVSAAATEGKRPEPEIQGAPSDAGATENPPPAEESHKKFSKKY